ncbi:MAG: hypothetical protein ACRDGE_11635 [Candidatus Limnocylindria bacterium]
MSTQTSAGDARPRLGPGLIVVAAFMFMIAAVVNILNPMQGEEGLALTTFAELQVTNPALADTIWHLNTGINAIVFGIGVLIALLAWTRLRRGSREAWYSIAIVAVTFAAAILLAHVPVGHPGAAHWGPPLVATALMFLGLGLSAKAVFSPSGSSAATRLVGERSA